MAISSVTFNNLSRSVEYLTGTDGSKQRSSSVGGEKASRSATLSVAADGSATRVSTLSTSSGASRQVSVTSDGQGNISRSVNVTTASGQQITRDTSISKSTDEDGNQSISINRTVNGLNSVRTFVADVTDSGATATLTVARGDATRSYSFSRGVTPEPVPGGHNAEGSVDQAPVDELA